MSILHVFIRVISAVTTTFVDDLFVELGRTLLKVLLASWLAEVLCNDRSLPISLVVSCITTWRRRAYWSGLVILDGSLG